MKCQVHWILQLKYKLNSLGISSPVSLNSVGQHVPLNINLGSLKFGEIFLFAKMSVST